MNAPLAHVFVTGGNGCIGSATVRDLLALGAGTVTVASRTGGRGSLDLWLDVAAEPRLRFVAVDLADRAAVRAALAEARPSHVIHLAALQSPDCQADPERGMRINVGGTLGVLDAAAAAGTVQRFVFASSAAVYGLRERYPTATVAEDAELAPPNLYGVWKVAGEQLARQFAERTGIATVCLRLNTTYGKGRDRGLTAAGTHAIRAVARGALRGTVEPFRMPYGGRENYHFVEDVAAHFAQCAARPFEGFGAFNLRGRTVAVEEFLAAIGSVAVELGHGDAVDLGLAAGAAPNPFVCDLDESAVTARFPGLPKTPLADGIRKTLEAFLADPVG
ncbi:MAG: SDR family oxidoreductase [Planctomycetes bacterium]|nr:SDR family oxidoreductase [Planctomycetota bacterium]